jgi:hypothetical protein
MENDEFESTDRPEVEETAEKHTSEPGPEQPEEFHFDDWALI